MRKLSDGQVFLLAWAAGNDGVLYTLAKVPLGVTTDQGRIDKPAVTMAQLVGLERRGYFVRRGAFSHLTNEGRQALRSAASICAALAAAAQQAEDEERR